MIFILLCIQVIFSWKFFRNVSVLNNEESIVSEVLFRLNLSSFSEISESRDDILIIRPTGENVTYFRESTPSDDNLIVNYWIEDSISKGEEKLYLILYKDEDGGTGQMKTNSLNFYMLKNADCSDGEDVDDNFEGKYLRNSIGNTDFSNNYDHDHTASVDSSYFNEDELSNCKNDTNGVGGGGTGNHRHTLSMSSTDANGEAPAKAYDLRLCKNTELKFIKNSVVVFRDNPNFEGGYFIQRFTDMDDRYPRITKSGNIGSNDDGHYHAWKIETSTSDYVGELVSSGSCTGPLYNHSHADISTYTEKSFTEAPSYINSWFGLYDGDEIHYTVGGENGMFVWYEATTEDEVKENLIGFEIYNDYDDTYFKGSSSEFGVLHEDETHSHTISGGVTGTADSQGRGCADDDQICVKTSHTHSFSELPSTAVVSDLPHASLMLLLKKENPENLLISIGTENRISCFGYDVDSGDECSQRGKCINFDTCKCNSEYEGPNCNLSWCFGLRSDDENSCGGKSHGTCVDTNTCECLPGYNGSQCELWYCQDYLYNDTDNVCSGRGECIHDYDGNWCNCSGIFEGESCETWKCFDKFESDPDVCEGNGKCNENGLCECYELSHGDECGEYECNNIDHDDSKVCNFNNGTCLINNTCECKPGYEGKFCEEWTCFGIDKNSSEVCGGQGTCVKLDECLCNEGYFEKDCNAYKCNEILYNDSSVCNGSACVEYNLCNCKDGKDPSDFCESFFCYDISGNQEDVCSKHGICIGHNVCKCDDGYSGEECGSSIAATVLAIVIPVVSFVAIIVIVAIIILIIILCASKKKTGGKRESSFNGFDSVEMETLKQNEEKLSKLEVNENFFSVNFDEIRIIKKIGESGSSTVYLAEWLEKHVAFKCFRIGTLLGNNDDENIFRDFEKEVQVLASVSHPNICRFLGASLKNPRVGILMEYCENGDLETFLTKHYKMGSPYPFKGKLRMIIEISSALEYLHEKNIYHRDLKSKNILVNNECVCKLFDFGLSKVIERKDTKMIRAGTSRYMSPEMVRGEKYNEKTDVFSFSIVMYEILTDNFNPYDTTNSDINVEYQVAKDPSFRPNLQRLAEHKWVCPLLEDCWADSHEKRKSFSEIIEFINTNKGIEDAEETQEEYVDKEKNQNQENQDLEEKNEKEKKDEKEEKNEPLKEEKNEKEKKEKKDEKEEPKKKKE